MVRPIALAGALLLVAGVVAYQLADVPPSAAVLRRLPAPEARQAVAVDEQFFYAIGDAVIGKYEKVTGRRVGEWRGDAAGPVRHLNSGVVLGRELYCAHSNYPLTPMVSSVEVFDTERMAHSRSIPLPSGLGSATWIEQGEGSWWVAFAHYSGKGGEPGKGPEATRLVRFTASWDRAGSWAFPATVVSRWDSMSSSGGALAAGRVFYTTGHHAPELYVVEVPETGEELRLRTIIRTETEGQGIALDRQKGTLYSIQRQTTEVIESALPATIRPKE